MFHPNPYPNSNLTFILLLSLSEDLQNVPTRKSVPRKKNSIGPHKDSYTHTHMHAHCNGLQCKVNHIKVKMCGGFLSEHEIWLTGSLVFRQPART